MNLQVVYCNHQTADLSLRERLAISVGEQLDRAYRELRSDFPKAEVVLLSTCNRIELYTAQEAPENPPTHQQLARFFSEFHDIPVSEFSEDFLERTGPDAVRHLFQVASSVDSMVLGEPQIVNQVKEAYRLAQENDACGPLTHALFKGAINVSKRVRHETRLAQGRVSIASVAVGEFGKSIFERFDDKTVLIVGAGEMAEETLQYLHSEGVHRIVIANRNLERAQAMARRLNLQAGESPANGGDGHPGQRPVGDSQGGIVCEPYDELDRLMATADVIVSTTGAETPIVDVERFAKVRSNNESKPVFILDLGAPRDFDPGVGDVDDNVFLYDIGDLEATCEQNRKARSKEIEKALRIIDEETNRFMQEIYHRATGPIIKRLREQWHDISLEEVGRLRAKLSHLDEDDLDAVQRSVERIINKLLHPPLEALRDEAREGTPHGLLDALKRLFHLRD